MSDAALIRLPLFGAVRRHYNFLKSLKPFPYVGIAVAENIFLSLVVGYLAVRLFGSAAARHFDLPYPYLFSLATTIGPLIETLVAQLMPYEVMAAVGLRRNLAFFISWAIFISIHISSGVGSALTAGLCAGFYLSLTYFIWRRVSIRSAYFMTFICHAIYNAALLGISFFFQ